MTSAHSMSILKGRVLRGGRWMHALRNGRVYAAAAMLRLRALAPYALIELILPGGSMVALLLWLYRRRKSGVAFGPLPMKILAVLRLVDPLTKAPVCAARSVVG